MASDLKKLTQKLGEEYRAWKTSEKNKNKTKTEFFEVITEALSQETGQRQIVTIYGPTEEEARARMAKYHPTMIIKEVHGQDGQDTFAMVVEPDPAYEPYTYVNPEDGMVYSRQISAGKLELDEDLMKEREPELYERVTFIPDKRELKSLDDLDPEDMAALSEYLYSAKPTVKLGAPRKAKPEELE